MADPVNDPDLAPGAPEVLDQLAREGAARIAGVAEAHHNAWGMGLAQTWSLDQETGLLTWTFLDRIASAPAQVLGSYSAEAGAFRWGWANPSLRWELMQDAERVRVWAETNEQSTLLVPEVGATEEQAEALAALAARVTEAGGFVRARTDTSTVYVTFGRVEIHTNQGEASEFEVLFQQT